MENAGYNSTQKNYNNRAEKYNDSAMLFENLKWLTTDDAAKFLRKSTHAIRLMSYKGLIRPRKFGGRLYFKKSELDQLIDTSFY